MIEIIREENLDGTKERDGLPKDIKQIGKPDIGERIYVENLAYQCMHPYQNLEEATTYVLLGRFENYAGRQCVFVEAVIRLEEIAFDGEIPIWNDHTWAYIYKQLKREYDNMVIVGWAMDIKGQLPNMTAKIEALHQNNFGGPHQVLFLMDSLEREEAFYSSRNGHLYRREGFYIYYGKARACEPVAWEMSGTEERIGAFEMHGTEENTIEREVSTIPENFAAHEQEYLEDNRQERYAFWRERFKEETVDEKATRNRGSYREQLYEKNQKSWGGSYAYTGFLVAIVCVLGATVHLNYQKLDAMEAAIAQMNEVQTTDTEPAKVTVETVAGEVEKQQTELAEVEKQKTDAAEKDVLTTESEEVYKETLDTEIKQTEPTETAESLVETEKVETVVKAEDTETIAETMTEAETYLKQGYYIVQKGDSLVGICRKIYQTTAMMDKLCEANDIEDEDAIYAGQYLTLPN